MTTGRAAIAEEPEQRALLEHLTRADPRSMGLPSPAASEDAVRVELLGAGQNYTAWQVVVIDDSGRSAFYTVRIARRALHEMPRPMAAEFAAMALVPAGIGPEPVHLERSSQLLGAPFMVTSFVPGQTVQPWEWTPALLVAHARQMAMLHERAYHGWGEVTVAPEQLTGGLDLDARFEKTANEWRRDYPQVVADPAIARLLPRAQSFIATAAPAFRRLEQFSLIHGDLGTPNIVVDRDVPRFVDWEYAQIGDPALDLATLGGAVPAPPWYLPLGPVEVDLVLRAYLDAGRNGTGEGLDVLRRRRDAWEAFERFFSLLYFRVETHRRGDGRAGHTATAKQLYAGLDRWLP